MSKGKRSSHFKQNCTPWVQSTLHIAAICPVSSTEVWSLFRNKQVRKRTGQKSKQIEVIDQEIKDTKALRRQADKTIKLLEHEFVTCVDKGEKKNDMYLVSKAMAIKQYRKSTGKQIELSNLEEALNVLKEIRKS